MIRLLLLSLALVASPLRAEEVVVGLSQNQVAITANFVGSEILVFGAIKRDGPIPDGPPLEIIITVEGPPSAVDVRMKQRRFGLWINTEAVEVDSAPSFYAISTTAPLFGILTHTEDLRHSVSIARGIRSVGAPPEVADAARFTDALIRLKRYEGLYRVEEGAVIFAEGALFQTSVDLPANLTEGTYRVRIFLTRDKRVVDAYETYIDVTKVGLERFLFGLAYDQPLLYGLLALVIAISAGWGASALFRFIRA